MGAIAESMVAYAQPLIDETDGSLEQVQMALTLAQMCWNMALSPESEHEQMLDEMRPVLDMDDAEFADFKETLVKPMILRYHEMFPDLPPMFSQNNMQLSPRREKKFPGTGRNEPCPCGSGKKYKRCCGK